MKTKSASGISLRSDYRSGFIAGCTIFTPLRRIERNGILFRQGRIVGFIDSQTPEDTVIHSFDGCLAVPGFIDIHFHGASGINFLDGTVDSAVTALATHLKEGTTSCVPTLMTAPPDVIRKAITAILEARQSDMSISEVIGINLEGPYISADRKGVHDRESIRAITADEMERLLEISQGMLRIVTVAPEMEGALTFIRYLTDRGIIASAGHTNASYDEMMAAVKSGVKLATHLFNAMRGIMQREPGALGALLVSDDVYSELIADGEHVHPALFRLVARVKGAERLILITDASPEYGMRKTASRTKNGTLVGGTLPLPGELKLLMQHSGLELESALRTITLNPAALLGLERRVGSLRKGADADIVILDRNLDVKAVFSKGERVV